MKIWLSELLLSSNVTKLQVKVVCTNFLINDAQKQDEWEKGRRLLERNYAMTLFSDVTSLKVVWYLQSKLHYFLRKRKWIHAEVVIFGPRRKDDGAQFAFSYAHHASKRNAAKENAAEENHFSQASEACRLIKIKAIPHAT